MDKALKQRLVGASVLIILAVIVLPMLLSGRSDTLKQESRQIELPTKPDELSIETRRFPVGVSNKPVPKQQAQQQSQAGGKEQTSPGSEFPEITDPGNDKSVQDSLSVAKTTGKLPGDTKSSSSTSVVTSPPTVTAITLSSGKDKDVNLPRGTDESENTPRYLVQVASFNSEKRANTLAAKLRSANLPVLMDVVERTAGRLHRVRVGPYVERADADAVVDSLRSEIKDLAPRVLDLRPGDSAPVSAPSDPLVRWVVQAGSFNSSESAEALVAKLRLAGLPAFSEKVSSVSGTAYKVRIGPEISRDNAADLARRVKQEQGLDAFVTTQE
jgi:cell division septation protein DedD